MQGRCATRGDAVADGRRHRDHQARYLAGNYAEQSPLHPRDNDRYAPRCDFIETVEEPPQPGHADIAYHHRRHAMESESTLRLDGDAHVGRTRAYNSDLGWYRRWYAMIEHRGPRERVKVEPALHTRIKLGETARIQLGEQ